MVWEEVRTAYPLQWVLVEAIEAHTEDNKRVIDELTVVDSFHDDSKKALLRYSSLHKAHPERELYVIHTSRTELDIEEQIWIGVRAGR